MYYVRLHPCAFLFFLWTKLCINSPDSSKH
jgi:hypothetical protein